MRFILTAIVLCGASILASTADARQRWLGHGRAVHAVAPHAGHFYMVPYPAHGAHTNPAAKPAYAYGWFGVKPRRHKGVHYGYYNHRTQWTHR